jgi:hypothetical protein
MANLKRAVRMFSRLLFVCIALAAAAFELTVPVAFAQTATQQRVYGSGSVTTSTSAVLGYSKDNTTGALTVLSEAPFVGRLEGGLVAIDGLGKFLFVLNPVSDSISMYQIDGSTGALAEVPNSPFAAGATINPNVAPSSPVSLASEKSGSFLYVGYAKGDSTTTSALVPFAIDATNLRLVLTPQLSLDIASGAPIQMVTDPKGLRLYVGIGPAPYQSTPGAGTTVYSIDPTSGVLTQTGNAGGGSELGRAIAMDAQGRFFFDAWGQTEGFLDSGVISPVDGSSGATFTLALGVGIFPSVLLTESSGKFLYVQTQGGLLIYSIDGSSGALTLLSGPLTSLAFEKGTVVADPMGPYIYSFGRSGVDVFQVNPQTGNLAEIPGAPFATGASTTLGNVGLAISGTPTQNATGPAAQVFPSSANFGQNAVAQRSGTRILSLVNTGNQILAVNTISVTGTNAGDFAQSNTCTATLAPNASCSISVEFTPSQVGPEQAMLQVTDDAAGSPQSAVVTGTGIATTPSVSISPASLDFGTVIEGATVAAKTIQVMNSGTGALHVSAISVSGSNPGDFSQSNACVGISVPAQSSCTITVKFSAAAQGQRLASLMVTDDATNSPQSIAVTGNLAYAFQLAVAPSGSASANVAAGSPAQYALQLAPGPGFAGTVIVSCSGAPLGAVCSASSSTIPVSSASAVPFQVTVTTSGSAILLPPGFVNPGWRRWFALATALVTLIYLLLLMNVGRRELHRFARRVEIRLAGFAAIAGLMLFHLSGCGGRASTTIGTTGSTTGGTTQVPQIVTPAGTSAITVTASSGSLTPQTIQLTLTVH